MSKISFEDIGNVTATFYADEGMKEGDVVRVTNRGTVGFCAMMETFIGVIGPIHNDVTTVQLGGFMKVRYSGDLPYGHVTLVSDGYGGVQTSETGGVPAQVVQVSMDGTAVIYL